MSRTTGYEYDAVGNLRSIANANFNQTGFEYDALGRQVHKVWPDGSFETFHYDAVGNLTEHRLADGHVNAFDYDDMNQLTRVDYFDGQIVTFGYTVGGLRETVTDERGVTTYAYDNRDRIIQATQPSGQTVAYAYDAAGNRLSMTTPSGTITYGYDAAGQLITVTDPEGRAFIYTYNDAGLRTQLSYPNGITVDYSYDQLDRLTGIVQRKGGVALASYTYSLGPAGNRLNVAEADGSTIEWAYDNAYRLVGETRFDGNGTAAAQTTYTYDPVGNRLSQIINGQTTTYTYNELDQLESAGAAQYTYDGRGNLVQVTDGADVTAYAWDAADRLIAIMLPDGTSIGHIYDADGRRVQESAGTQITNYLWDEASLYGDVVLEADGSGTPLVSYVLGGTELLTQNRGGTVSYYLHDGQGSIRALADVNGNVTDFYSYTAFGDLLVHQGITENPYQYTGQQFNELTGLYNLRARYYEPLNGRFLNRDTHPADLQDPLELNRYPYVGNDPINLVDTTGYQATIEYSTQTSDDHAQAEGPRQAGQKIRGDEELIDDLIQKRRLRMMNKDYAGKVWNNFKDPALKAKYPDGVRFNQRGFADFKPYARKEVRIIQKGTRADFTAANRAAGFKKTPKGWTWHHVEDRMTMQLVPRDLHRAVSHTGGCAIIRLIGTLTGLAF